MKMNKRDFISLLGGATVIPPDVLSIADEVIE
jgi:hypothetical protein